MSEEELVPGPPYELRSVAAGPWLEHNYGDRARVLCCPWMNAALGRLSSPDTGYTELVALVRAATSRLAIEAFRLEFPRQAGTRTTRMAEEHGPLGVWRGELFDSDMAVNVIDVIRGGMIPAQTCFELLTLVHPIDRLRLDHLNLQRIEGEDGHVERVELTGAKVGGTIEDSILVVPDPMGATGATIRRVVEFLEERHGTPRAIVVIALIATPEFLRTILDLAPSARVYAGRLDRGMSSARALAAIPGSFPDEESGLDGNDYIVPGAGGLGELLSHSWA